MQGDHHTREEPEACGDYGEDGGAAQRVVVKRRHEDRLKKLAPPSAPVSVHVFPDSHSPSLLQEMDGRLLHWPSHLCIVSRVCVFGLFTC